MNERRLLAIILGFSAFRLAVAPAFQLFPQEAYYDLYARYLALSYSDHPPMVGWLLWGFTAVLGQHAWVLEALCLLPERRHAAFAVEVDPRGGALPSGGCPRCCCWSRP